MTCLQVWTKSKQTNKNNPNTSFSFRFEHLVCMHLCCLLCIYADNVIRGLVATVSVAKEAHNLVRTGAFRMQAAKESAPAR